jgi:hypothetical protein
VDAATNAPAAEGTHVDATSSTCIESNSAPPAPAALEDVDASSAADAAAAPPAPAAPDADMIVLPSGKVIPAPALRPVFAPTAASPQAAEPHSGPATAASAATSGEATLAAALDSMSRPPPIVARTHTRVSLSLPHPPLRALNVLLPAPPRHPGLEIAELGGPSAVRAAAALVPSSAHVMRVMDRYVALAPALSYLMFVSSRFSPATPQDPSATAGAPALATPRGAAQALRRRRAHAQGPPRHARGRRQADSPASGTSTPRQSHSRAHSPSLTPSLPQYTPVTTASDAPAAQGELHTAVPLRVLIRVTRTVRRPRVAPPAPAEIQDPPANLPTTDPARAAASTANAFRQAPAPGPAWPAGALLPLGVGFPAVLSRRMHSRTVAQSLVETCRSMSAALPVQAQAQGDKAELGEEKTEQSEEEQQPAVETKPAVKKYVLFIRRQMLPPSFFSLLPFIRTQETRPDPHQGGPPRCRHLADGPRLRRAPAQGRPRPRGHGPARPPCSLAHLGGGHPHVQQPPRGGILTTYAHRLCTCC